MIKLALATIFFNNHLEISRLVRSVPFDCIDKWIFIDGIYRYTAEKYPDLPYLSDDGTRKLLYSLIPETILTLYDYPCKLEFQKRQKYLDICKELDIDGLIIIDTDEFFIYPETNYLSHRDVWMRFRDEIEDLLKTTNHNIFSMFEVWRNKDINPRPRLWLRPGEMAYLYGSHYHFGNTLLEQDKIRYYQSIGSCYNQHALKTIDTDLKIGHDHYLRYAKYLEMRQRYGEYLQRFESLVQSHKFTIEEAHKLAKGKELDTYRSLRDLKNLNKNS